MLQERLSNSVEGIVTHVESALFHVLAEGRTIPCVLRGRLKQKWQRVTSLVVVGDKVGVAARQGGMDPILVVNKCDLEDERMIRSWVAPFEATCVRIVLVSALQVKGLEELRSALYGRVSVLAGQSGVGKSSLVNALFPELSLRTQGMSVHNKGRHTTTSSRLYPLPGGGFLADTPGIKSLELADTSVEDLADVFPDIEDLAAQCKFRLQPYA